jgi:mono/diheme cytochrome c family protein
MGDRNDLQARDLKVAPLLLLFAVLSVLVLVALGVAPARAYFSDWRAVQKTYNRLAKRAGVAEIPVSIKQIWKPELGVVDRCASCHLATDGLAPIEGQKLFAAHPAIPHEPREFGCTVCHGGQGRATTAVAAHGDGRSGNEPMLSRGLYEAGCGTCHSNLKMGQAQLVEKGATLVRDSHCRDCHRSGNAAAGAATATAAAGAGPAPDLSTIGLHGFRSDWHTKHLEHSSTAQTGPWATSFSPLADDEVAAVGEFLRGEVGAPRLMAGKGLAYRRGCLGCHRIGGVGGDDGPDLSNEGQKPMADLPFTQVTGARTLPNWLKQHFLDPAKVVAKSQMPKLGFSDGEADRLTLFVLSLRTRDIPEGLAPRDRVRGRRLGERDFATDGESLFGVFCAACHGPRGEGRRFATLASVFPAIGEPEFLAVADDPFLRKTLMTGRPGRRMPAWGAKDGGLRPQEIDAIVTYLRTLAPTAPTFEEVNAATIDRNKGDELFGHLCAHCHGKGGQGSAVAPPLAAVDNPVTHDDNRIYGTVTIGVGGTAMGSFRQLDAGSLRSLIASVRALAPVKAKRTGWVAKHGDPARGASTFARQCARCHGPGGQGVKAPALANAAFLAAATDGYLTATILRGRGATKMPHFGTAAADHPQLGPDTVVDLVAFVRTLSPASVAAR